ncbi:MAG: hypothetical protein LKE53_00790 [Oscillospiraceae bacterium]|jgi:hypothetical protein|nr:hypothetical protein [Oscillospiraceae bacterium]
MRLLIIWCEKALGRQVAQNALRTLVSKWSGGIGLCTEEASNEIVPGGADNREEAPEDLVIRYDCFLVPLLPTEMLGHLLAAKTQSPAEVLLRAALCSKKPVLLLPAALGPENETNTRGTSPLLKKVLQQRKQAALLGFQTMDMQNILNLQQKRAAPFQLQNRIVTEKDILEAFKSGSRVAALPDSAVVTPLAADTAREKKIELVKEGAP